VPSKLILHIRIPNTAFYDFVRYRAIFGYGVEPCLRANLKAVLIRVAFGRERVVYTLYKLGTAYNPIITKSYLLWYKSSAVVVQDGTSVLILVLGLPHVAGDDEGLSFSKNTESPSPPAARNDNGDSVGGDGVVTDGQVVDDGDSGDVIGDNGDVGEDVSVADFLLSRGREPLVLILKYWTKK